MSENIYKYVRDGRASHRPAHRVANVGRTRKNAEHFLDYQSYKDQ